MSQSTPTDGNHGLPFEGILPGRPEPYFLRDGEGEKSVVFDQLFTVLLSGDETENQYGVFTADAPAGERIPAHQHLTTHEIFYIVGGSLHLWVDDQKGFHTKRTLGAGDFAFVPTKVVHAFQVEKTVRILGVSTAGFERFFHEMGTPTEKTGIPEVPYITPIQQMLAAGAAHETVFMPDWHFKD